MKKVLTDHIILVLILLLVLLPVVAGLAVQKEASSDRLEDVDQYLEIICSQIRRSYARSAGDWDAFEEEVLLLPLWNSALGSLIILDDDLQMIFPNASGVKEGYRELAGELAQAIQHGAVKPRSFFKAADKTAYRVMLEELYQNNSRVRYMIAFVNIDSIVGMIFPLTGKLMIITAVFSALLLLLLYIFIRSIISSVNSLDTEFKRIGAGDLSAIAVPYFQRDTEKLRTTVNDLLEQLQLVINQQKTMIRSVNHYLRNRLTVIDGYAQGLETGIFTPEEASKKIILENATIKEILYNLSYKSFVEEKLFSKSREKIFLADEVEECFARYHHLAELENISLSMEIEDYSIAVSGIRSLMEIVTGNLVSNAIRYADKTVTVSVAETDEKVVIRVEDDGPEISEKDMENLFEPLYKGPGGNMGIGLVVARDAAGCMDGTLAAANRPEGGAVFTVTFPRLKKISVR